MRSNRALFLLLFCLFLSGCDAFKSLRELRESRAEKAQGDIQIAVAWPLESMRSHFPKGVELAASQINEGKGILGRKVRIRFLDDESSVTKGLIIAQQLVDDPDVVAVIGHYNSYISLPAATVYNNGGIVMISPGSTNPMLTKRKLPLVFRNIPNDDEFGKQLANFAEMKSFNRVIIYYTNNSYGRGLANAFEDRANELGLNIVDRLPYDAGSAHEFLQALGKWRFYEYDCIFLAGTVPEAAHFIKAVRKHGLDVPILGSDGLDVAGLMTEAGVDAEGTLVITVYSGGIESHENLAFRKSFRDKYAAEPDMWSAQGYDALMILAQGYEKAGSTSPSKLASALKSTDAFDMVTGSYRFDEYGDLQNKAFFIKIVENGEFVHLMDL